MAMQEERAQSSLYMLFGVFFTVIALVSLVSLIVVRTRAGANTTTIQTANITNEAPTIVAGSVKVFSTGANPVQIFTLTGIEGAYGAGVPKDSTADTVINYIVNDVNGAANIGASQVSAWADGTLNGSACSDDNGYSCNQTVVTNIDGLDGFACTATACTFAASFPIRSWAKPGIWHVSVKASDLSQASSAPVVNVDALTVSTLRSVDLTAAVLYGTMAIGESKTMPGIASSWGNMSSGLEAKAAPLICDGVGSAKIFPQLVSINGVAMNADASTLATITGFNLNPPTVAESTSTLTFGLGPIPNVSGSCTGNIYATAIPGL